MRALTESFSTALRCLCSDRHPAGCHHGSAGTAPRLLFPQQKNPTFQHFCPHLGEKQMQNNCEENFSAFPPNVSIGFSFTNSELHLPFDTNPRDKAGEPAAGSYKNTSRPQNQWKFLENRPSVTSSHLKQYEVTRCSGVCLEKGVPNSPPLQTSQY